MAEQGPYRKLKRRLKGCRVPGRNPVDSDSRTSRVVSRRPRQRRGLFGRHQLGCLSSESLCDLESFEHCRVDLDNEEFGCDQYISSFPRISLLKQQNQSIIALKQNLSACFNSGFVVDIEALVLELQPGTLLYPTICSEAQCWQNECWLHDLDEYCKYLDCSAEHGLKTLVKIVLLWAVLENQYNIQQV
ncbi:hypothetical protein scyTo_0018240 [Scyliorhinus torazame]|uniref:Uncharacterized protein n=1 Tax=Scyliorhinus torazame TaxID=75743 RepID=A0A401PRA3_SCYTO|nr:hypothetical protein [Scyliorhinus torazame]